MANFNSFSDSVEKVLQNASRIAKQYGSFQVGTEHILYGLTCLPECASAKILAEYGINKESLEIIFDESTEFVELNGVIEMTPQVKEMIKISQKIAMQLGHTFIGTEHILYAILSSSSSFAVKLLTSYFHVNINDLKTRVLIILQGEGKEIGEDTAKTGNQGTLPEKLLNMGTDITQKAKEGKIDPVIGREGEIERLIEILCRKTKNNPVLIGEAGVGKTAVVEGLAQAIVEGNVPELLANKIIYSLEIGGLMAGTKYRGSMEERLKSAIQEIINQKNIIVFIDEIHTLAQAGSEKGETSPADMLKPYLARGELQTIGATTTDEYRKFVEKDKALERRFQPIMVKPATVEQTIEILNGLKDSYEAFHKVIITNEAIEAAANLADRYIMDRSLPDKAIDLIDEASSKAKVNFNLKPVAIREKEEKIKQLSANRDEASIQRNYEKAAKLQSQIINLENELDVLNAEFNQKAKKSSGSIGANEIAEVVAKWTGIPVTKITETEKEKLMNLEEILHKRVIGQNEAVSAVARAIRRSRVGLQDTKRPIGSFLFMGQTGVGKTELSKALAEAMFDDENSIIRIDMSEFMEGHSVAKLIGAPPGYVGYDEGGQLTEQVRRRPYSVVLFDEIEKAHPDIFNALLQILDDGRLTDSQGRVVSFKNTIIIMTSNVGAMQARAKELGFNEKSESLDFEKTKEIYFEALKKKFKPEFINRIDVICVFQPLTKDDLTKIAKILINNINSRLKKQNLELKITEDALNFVIENGCKNTEYGARPLKRYIQQEIEDSIAEKILLNKINKTGVVIIDTSENGLTFESE
ncbi:MAG: ATP-dependent Clp protease ATP-binding subunit [Clostridia bacterium]|nr:ATP-dependent Clp protease ATP-binding subunit [Clostridia bacterium]